MEAGLFYWSSRSLPSPKIFEQGIRHLSSEGINALTNPIDPYVDPARVFEKERGYSMRSFDQVDFTSTNAFLLGTLLDVCTSCPNICVFVYLSVSLYVDR